MREVWRAIEGYEDSYEVSNKGRVKSLSRLVWNGTGFFKSKEKILKIRLSKNKDHYATVALRKGNTSKTIYIHRLVAETFIRKPVGKDYVNHIDEDKLNNDVANLEWVTPSENLNYGDNQKRKGNKRFVPVIGVHVDTKETVVLTTMEETQAKGFSKVCISKVVTGRNKTHKGYKWYYLSEYKTAN